MEDIFPAVRSDGERVFGGGSCEAVQEVWAMLRGVELSEVHADVGDGGKAEVGELPDNAEASRTRLATIILDLANSGIIADANQLKDIAVKAFRASRREPQ